MDSNLRHGKQNKHDITTNQIDCNCIRLGCRLCRLYRLSNASRIFSRCCNRTLKSPILRKPISRDHFTSHEPEFKHSSWLFSLQPTCLVYLYTIYILFLISQRHNTGMQVCKIDGEQADRYGIRRWTQTQTRYTEKKIC